MPSTELLQGLRALTSWLRGSCSRDASANATVAGAFALPLSTHGPTLLDVALRAGHLACAAMRAPSGTLPPSSTLIPERAAAQTLGGSVVTAVEELWTAFADTLQACDLYRCMPGVPGEESLVLGASVGTYSSPQSSPPFHSRHSNESASVPSFVRCLVDEYVALLQEGQRAEVAALTAVLADFFEQSSPACRAVAANSALLSQLLYGVFADSVVPHQSGSTVEALLCLLHHVFTESRRTPCGLELLAHTLMNRADAEPHGNFVDSLVTVLGRYGDDGTITANALTVLHHLLACATTACQTLHGDTDEAAAQQEWGKGSAAAEGDTCAGVGTGSVGALVSPFVTRRLVKAVTPFTLSADEAVSALACNVTRLALETLRTSTGAGGGGPDSLSWVADYAAEAILIASDRTVFAAIALLDEVALSTVEIGGEGATRDVVAFARGGRERLPTYAHVAALSPAAFERALDGPYLRWLLTGAGLTLEDTAEFVRQILSSDPNAPSVADEGEGKEMDAEDLPTPTVGLYGVVSLSELLMVAAGVDGVAAVPIECIASVARAVLTQVGRVIGPGFNDYLSTDVAGVDYHGGNDFAGLALSAELNTPTLDKLLAILGFFLPRAAELNGIAFLALAELTRDTVLVEERAPCVTAVAYLRIAVALLRSAHDTPEGCCGSLLATLVQAGLIDRLLATSAQAKAACPVEEVLEGLRASLVWELSGAHDGECALPSLRGACSLDEVVLRCLYPLATSPLAAALGSRLLERLAAYGCRPVLEETELTEATQRAFATFTSLLGVRRDSDAVDTLRGMPEHREHGGYSEHEPSRSREASAASAHAHMLRLCLVHLHWFRRIPSTALVKRASDDSTHGGGGSDRGVLIPMCTSLTLRRYIADTLQAFSAGFPATNLPTVDALISALLTEPWLFSFATHTCLAGLIGALEDNDTQGDAIAPPGQRAKDPWGRLLTDAASVDTGDEFFRGVFAVIQSWMRRRHRHLISGDSGRLPVLLLGFIQGWLRETTVSAVWPPSSQPGSVTRCLLSRHCPPFLLSWSANVSSDDAAELTRAVARMLVACLSLVGPADSSGSDGVVLRWWMREMVREDVPSRHTLQLLCLMLERTHGSEVARVYGTSVLVPLMQRVTTTGAGHGGNCPLKATLAGVIQYLLSLYAPRGEDAWRRWREHLPITSFAGRHSGTSSGILDTTSETSSERSRLRHLGLRACDFYFHRSLSGLYQKGHPMPTVTPATVREHEMRDVHAMLDCSMDVIMSPAREDLRCRTSACRVLCTMLCAYRELVCDSTRVAALHLVCAREAELLPLIPRGWVLAGLLFVAPSVPWNGIAAGAHHPGNDIAKVARRFLTMLDRPAPAPPRDAAAHDMLDDDWELECREMLSALTAGCRYYSEALPDAPAFPQHRIKDFFDSENGAVTAVGSDPDGACFLIRNQLNVVLTS